LRCKVCRHILTAKPKEEEDLKEQIENLKKQIQFNESEHIYTKNGIVLPSVTQIMNPLYDAVYGKANMNASDNGKSKGKEIHRAIDDYCEFGMIDISEEYKPYLYSFIKYLDDKGLTVVASEVMLCHPVYNYAGTIDIIATNPKNQYVMIDNKTGGLQALLHSVQLQAYTDMWSANKMPEIAYKVALGLSDKGYEEKVYSKYDAKAKSVFDACYKIHNFKKEL
jgi:hypothetical protein